MSDPDPVRAPPPAGRPLPRRFYKSVGVDGDGDAFVVALDGRPVRTPGRKALSLPTRALAEAVAEEWSAQDTVIDPSRMPLTRLVNSALDGVAQEHGSVRDELRRYAGSDLLCYRATGPAGLVQRQSETWDPVLAWAHERLGIALVIGRGIGHIAQPAAALARVGALLAPLPPLRLAALHVITTLTGSALLALAVLKERLPPEAAWEAAHVDEDWNISRWGADEEAACRRRQRWAEMLAAARLLALTA